MKKIFILTMILTLMTLSFTACGPKDTVNDDAKTNEEGQVTKEEAKTFTVGFDQDFPPMGFVGDDGEFTGFDIDLAKEVAKRLNYELVLQPIAWDSKDMELTSGNIDCIWNGFTINGREDAYTWTDAYMSNKQVFVVRADSGITTFDDLTSKVVAAQIDSSADAALKEVPTLMASFGEYMTSPDYNSALMDLESGAVDAVAMDDTVARYQIEKRDANFVVLEETLAAEEYGVGFLLGNETLRDQVQTTLEEMAADGTLAEISNNWFGKDITTIGK